MNPLQHKNVIFKRIHTDFKNKCLIVYYDSIGEQRNSIVRNQSCKQIIKINKLDPNQSNKNVNIEKIARKILRKSHVIPIINYQELLGQLLELDRKCLKCLSVQNDQYSPLLTYNFLQFILTSDIIDNLNSTISSSSISIRNLDNYIELLYEELDDKIKGAYLILHSLSNVDCSLENLSRNDTLLCALSRVFREDGKKSIELAICIACIFGHFSRFTDFHFTITNYKVGSVCLELIYYEMLRQESWLKELMKKRETIENNDNNNNQNDNDNGDIRNEYERLSLQHQTLIQKQNILFRYTLYILLNISEDLKLEFKIQQKGIISILGKLLFERNNQELLLIVILFLKKLSVFIENKQLIKEYSIYKNLTPLLYLDNELLIVNTLKLLYNLMIDRDIRSHLIRSGIVPKLMSFFLKDRYSSIIVSIFYLISCEQKYSSLFKQHEPVIEFLMAKVFINIDYKSIVIKLLTNLAINNQDLAMIMIENNDERLSELINMAIDDCDVHLLRLCRNITCHYQQYTNLKLDSNIVNRLFESIRQSSSSTEVQIECSAILSNFSSAIEQDQWISLFQQHSIIDFISNYRITDKKLNQPEALSYLLNMISKATMVNDEEMARYFIDNQMIDHLLNVINLNQENDRIVSNAIYCLYSLIKQTDDQRRNALCENKKLIDYLIELMYDKNYRIKTLCNFTLDILADCDTEQARILFDRVCKEKFNAHNNKWLSMIHMRSNSTESNNLFEDMFIYPDLFLKMNVLGDSSGSDNFSDDNNNN